MTYNFPPDPGQVFESDTHRRVLSIVFLENDSTSAIDARADLDPYIVVSGEDLVEVLKDLEAQGYIENVDGDWQRTDLGHEKLTGSDSTPDEEDDE